MLCFGACCCLGVTLLGVTAWAEAPSGLVKLGMPQDKRVLRGAVARLGPVSRPPCGLQHPATSCLMREADAGRVWPQALRVSTLFSCWCLPKSLSCHRHVKKGGWSWCRTLHPDILEM